jgi:hypothetical protein
MVGKLFVWVLPRGAAEWWVIRSGHQGQGDKSGGVTTFV